MNIEDMTQQQIISHLGRMSNSLLLAFAVVEDGKVRVGAYGKGSEYLGYCLDACEGKVDEMDLKTRNKEAKRPQIKVIK